MVLCGGTKSVEVVKEKPFSAYAPEEAKGGCDVAASKTALVCIEFQNEFTTEGGKLHDAVKGVMASTGMLEKAAALADEVRGAGGKVFHVPIMFKEDATDNPNKKLGILAGSGAAACIPRQQNEAQPLRLPHFGDHLRRGRVRHRLQRGPRGRSGSCGVVTASSGATRYVRGKKEMPAACFAMRSSTCP